jgi:methylated-DNA-[protein]-cysteine S-methyltransferase
MTVPAELDRRFRDAALAAGSVDVAYDLVDSPLGELLVAVSDAGLCRVGFDGEAELDGLARASGVRVLRTPRPVDAAKRQLAEYFDGRRREFALGVDLRPVPSFQRSVLEELCRVPYGEVSTYGTLAERIGKPRAARAVGGALNRNPVPIVVPCHRIVGSTGSLVGYGGGLHRKRALLDLERSRLGELES